MPKASDAFRTISEVAEDLDVPKHVLRFWEAKFPQIRPMKRGGGRRYYRPDDVELLRGIRVLLYSEGFTIRGVQKILREHGLEQVKASGSLGTLAVVSSVDPPPKVAAASTKKSAARKKAKATSVVLDEHITKTLEKAISELEDCRKLLLAAA